MIIFLDLFRDCVAIFVELLTLSVVYRSISSMHDVIAIEHVERDLGLLLHETLCFE